MLHAMMEFFSGASTPIPTDTLFVRQNGFAYGTWEYPPVNAVVKGERLDFMEWDTPAIYLLAQDSEEHWPMTGYKLVTYPLEAYVVWIYKQNATGDAGTQGLWAFYALLDDLATQIRGNPVLTTPSYPIPGASVIQWGKDFAIHEKHSRMENSLLMSAQFVIQAQEQVSAP